MAAREVEVLGLSVQVDDEVLEDYEVLEAVAEIQDDSSEGTEKLSAMVRLFKILLGEQYQRVKKELREQGSGRLSAERMTEFLSGLFNALEVKN